MESGERIRMGNGMRDRGRSGMWDGMRDQGWSGMWDGMGKEMALGIHKNAHIYQ
jgi:hypothetical protein